MKIVWLNVEIGRVCVCLCAFVRSSEWWTGKWMEWYGKAYQTFTANTQIASLKIYTFFKFSISISIFTHEKSIKHKLTNKHYFLWYFLPLILSISLSVSRERALPLACTAHVRRDNQPTKWRTFLIIFILVWYLCCCVHYRF